MTKQIRVKLGYRGPRTGEQFIKPGDYDIDDPALFDAGEFLLKNGRAVEIGSKPEKPPQRAVDRDLAGRPIQMDAPPDRVNTPATLAPFEHAANRLSAENMPPLENYAGVTVPGTVMTTLAEPTETPAEPQGLAAMTVPQLREYALAIGMNVDGLTTKETLIPAIDAYMAGQAEPDGSTVNLTAMTVDQLKDFAAEQGFNIKGLSKKGELVAAIGKQVINGPSVDNPDDDEDEG